jgi:hypothetical protein
VANDGPALSDLELEVHFGDFAVSGMDRVMALDAPRPGPDAAAARFDGSIAVLRLDRLEGYRAVPVGEVTVSAPEVPGSHDLLIRLRAGNRRVAENRYPVHVVDEPHAPFAVRVWGDETTEAALALVGALPSGEGPLVVGEGHLPAAEADVRQSLAEGNVVVVLAQPPEAAGHYPLPVRFERVGTAWGSSVFQFTTDAGAIPSLPRRAVLVAEDSNIQATSAIVQIDGRPFPETAVVVAYKPVPNAVTGTILGSHPALGGRLVFCQYRLCAGGAAGDVVARAVLADLVRWAAQPSRVMAKETIRKEDGRRLTFYTWSARVAG